LRTPRIQSDGNAPSDHGMRTTGPVRPGALLRLRAISDDLSCACRADRARAGLAVPWWVRAAARIVRGQLGLARRFAGAVS